MLKNMNMRKKLFLFPVLFILIVIGSGLEIEHKIQSLRKAMKGECAKYLSALQIEKA